MTIRKASYNETQNIVNHAPIVLKEATLGYVEPNHETAHRIVSMFLAGGGYYLVYTQQNVIQGWLGIGESHDYFTDERIGYISEIYVLPPYRNQGIAKIMCTEVFKKLKEEGYTRVQLNVFTGNHAKHLYQKIGFQHISILMEIKL